MAAIIKRTYKVKQGDGTIVEKQCAKWTIQYRDEAGRIKRVKGYKDKAATMQLAARLERNLSRGEEGLTDPFKAHRNRALAEHFAEYIDALRSAGRDAMYVYNMNNRLTRLATDCGWEVLGHIEPNSFIAWRSKASKEKTRSHGQLTDKVSARTLNQYLETIRAFLNWCVDKKRIGSNQLQGVDKVEGAVVRKRRALSDEQVSSLLGIAPPERRLVYRMGLSTGLRRQELADLLWGDVGLRAIKPYVQLRAEATKSRRGDRLALQQTLAEDLRKMRPEQAADSDHVFPNVPAIQTWKTDLELAGIPYKDAMGRQADFHAGTRKTLCTRMNRAGVPLAQAMRVMRHTNSKLTMVDYVDDEQVGMDEVIAKIPEIQPLIPVASQNKTATA